MAGSSQDLEVPVPSLPNDERLESWKEIAVYLNRDVSTEARQTAELLHSKTESLPTKKEKRRHHHLLASWPLLAVTRHALSTS